MIKKRIKKLRELLKINNLDGYIVPKNDAYFAEFSMPDRLKSISNFSGSYGFALILKNKNYLFVDGRYTLQAKKESGKDFKIVEIHKFLPKQILKKYNKRVIGYDPQLFTIIGLNRLIGSSSILKPIKKNLVDSIKSPEKRKILHPFYNLSHKIAGEKIQSKINRLIKNIKSKRIDNIFISAPENVAWLLNIRGKDNPYSPVPNCKIILTKQKKIYFFSCSKKIKKIKNRIPFKNFKFLTYESFSRIMTELPGKSFCIDALTCSVENEKIIRSKFSIKNYKDPCYLMKSIKNKTEINYMKNSHLEDGLALTKFICWIKSSLNKNFRVTELDAQKKLEKFRKLNKSYLFPSFNTISGTGANGAIIHYRATKESSKVINKKDLFLCDSGGQYKYGTTDVTRTICFSEQPQRIKDIYTKVLKGHIAVVTSNLSRYNNGRQIDIRARKYLKKDGLDYAHGTGHGVGFFSNVHEGPQSISKYNTIKLQKGMVVSNEPGYYKENHFGIRIENLIFVNKKKKLFFENLTLSPIEKDLVNYKLLNKKERDYLDTYHLDILSKYYKYLNKPEKKWLLTLI